MVATGLLTSMVAMVAAPPWAEAASVNPGVVGNFEIEGDQISAAGGTIDWVDTDPTVLTDAISPDNGLQGSSKEDEPEDFTCQGHSPTVTPGKDNIVRAYINTRVTGVDSEFLDLGFVRDDGGIQGDSHMNFEFNQDPITNLCPYTGRTDGDLLITFDFPGNAALPANVQTFAWDSDAPDGSDEPGKWVPFTFAGSAAADDNTATITDQVVGGSIAPRAFGEATIDLVALAEASGDDDGCASFGFASVRSRSSGESFESALQDIVGGPVDVTTCGGLIVHKTDDAGTPLAEAVFGLWPDGVAVPPVGVDGTRPSTGSVATCTSVADGTCTFDAIDPGDYQVAELTPPADHDIDPDVVDVTVPFRQTIEVGAPFVDPLHTGNVTITKRLFEDANDNGVLDEGEEVTPAQLTDLDGITFELQQGGVTAKTHPAGADAECTITGGTGQCTISSVKLGTYDIKETLSPTGPGGIGVGDSPSVTVDEDGETVTAFYDNPLTPIGIDLDKSGDTLAHVGETVGYDFTVTNTTNVDLLDVELTDPDCNEDTIELVDDGDGDDVLAPAEVWSYTCERTITAEDVVVVDGQDMALNTGTVTAHDALGRPVDDTDPHEVLIITPDIEIVKTVDDDTPAVGQTVTFTYVVTNTGNTTLFGVDVDDDKLGPIGTIDELAPGESATLTKTMVVAADSPTRNVATADGEDVLGKHVDDEDDATITLVQGVVIVAKPQVLPTTGATGINRLLAFAGILLVLGGALTLTGGPLVARVRRRR